MVVPDSDAAPQVWTVNAKDKQLIYVKIPDILRFFLYIQPFIEVEGKDFSRLQLTWNLTQMKKLNKPKFTLKSLFLHLRFESYIKMSTALKYFPIMEIKVIQIQLIPRFCSQFAHTCGTQ